MCAVNIEISPFGQEPAPSHSLVTLNLILCSSPLGTRIHPYMYCTCPLEGTHVHAPAHMGIVALSKVSQ